MRSFFAAFIMSALLCACTRASGNDSGSGPDDMGGGTVTVTVDPDSTLLESRLLLSTTLTHRTFVHPAYTQSVARAEGFLRDYADCLGQFTMDWGAGNTNPSKDTYNWKELDKRMELFARLGRKPVLTLCRCPAWMRRDDPGKGADAAPRRDMYEEFGHMAAEMVRHYDQKGIGIFAVNVWSEVRGYWSPTLGRWELEDYADLYNIVYDSIKKVNPAIRVGGPFMHIESSPKGKNMAGYAGDISSTDLAALKAFLSKARKMDYFSIDRNLKENSDVTPYGKDEILKYTKFNGVVHRQCRDLLAQYGFDGVPVWVVDNQCLKGHWPSDIEAAGLASMFRWHLLGGAGLVDKWQPEDEGHEGADSEQIAPEGLYTHIYSGTGADDGAQPLPAFHVFRDYKTHFPPGTRILSATSGDEMVEVLASSTHLMLINKQSGEKTVLIKVRGKGEREKTVTLEGYRVLTLEY